MKTNTTNVDDLFLREHDQDIKRLVQDAARRLPCPHDFVKANLDELLNDVRLLVWTYFDSERGALSTFVYRCTKTTLIKMWTRHVRGSMHTLNLNGLSAISHNDEFDVDLMTERGVQNNYGSMDEVDHAAWVKWLQEGVLTPREAELVGHLDDGLRKFEAAKEMGVSQERVNQLSKSAGAKVTADMLEAAGRVSFAMLG